MSGCWVIGYGRGEMILKERERLKKMAIIGRRNEYQKLKLTTNQKKTFIFELLTKYSLRKSSL